MKKSVPNLSINLLLFVFLFLTFSSFGQTTITSLKSGNWNASSTWVGGIVPNQTNHVIINTGHLITMSDSDKETIDLTIHAGGVLDTTLYDIVANGSLLINGTITGIASSKLKTKGSTYSFDGTGTISTTQVQFLGTLVNFPTTANLTFLCSFFLVDSPIINYGVISTLDFQGARSGSWTNVGTLNFNGTAFGSLANGFTLDLSPTCNTVNYSRAGDQTVYNVLYQKLTFSGSGDKTIGTSANGRLNNQILNITDAAKAKITNTNIVVKYLTFNNVPQVSGTWGSTAAVLATNKNDTYFTNLNIRYINVENVYTFMILSPITGNNPQCPSLKNQTYSIPAVAGATTYTWTVPSGWTITSGDGTRTITVTTGTSGGNITVVASNACEISAPKTFAVSVNPSSIDFDGIDDYVDFGNVHNLSSSFSLEAWVLQKTATTTGTIISKRNVNTGTLRGYHLVLNNGKPNLTWYNSSGTIVLNMESPFAIANNKWYHIAATYNGATAILYIDGIEVVRSNQATAPTTSTENFHIGAMYDSSAPTNPKNYFNGFIDEVRIWNTALSAVQIREMMNQEIQLRGTAIRGKIIPIDISGGLLWTNLKGYYPMNDGTATDQSGNTVKINGVPKNICLIQSQTAPMPYTTKAGGTGTWLDTASWTLGSTVWNIPNSTGINGTTKIDWNIVQMDHNLTTVSDRVLLGLLVNSNSQLNVTGNSKLEISSYLKLNGKIDLVGQAQLLQTTNSILDPTSAGVLERDQQGQANKYNYNYWSSPVGASNNSTNNNNFTVGGILRDGTNPASPTTINWVGGFDGSPGQPISLARYWIYKFDNLASNYYNWSRINETGALQAGKGFTLKGSGASSATQNLTFLGKPNNGTISNTISSDNLLLVGNPYPSAIDADKFIDDNIGAIDTSVSNPVIDGSLYFWEHFATNNTHILREYQGGYGIYNKSGGVPHSSIGVDFISGAGTSSKPAPSRYITVGQGFFVNGKIGTSGSVVFNNSQRAFVKEDDINSSSMSRLSQNSKKPGVKTDNTVAAVEMDKHKKIRLGFNFYNQNFHRQVLLAFMDEKANSEMNDGYDAISIDDSPSDMYLLCEENELTIQGEGYFDEKASFPVGVRLESAGKIAFVIDALENFDAKQDVFIYDDETKKYHNIVKDAYELELPKGEYNSRFALRFTNNNALTNKTLKVETVKEEDVLVLYSNNYKMLIIRNNDIFSKVEMIELYSITGQKIDFWNVKDNSETNIQIPIRNISEGIYVVKIKTSNGDLSKKIVVQ